LTSQTPALQPGFSFDEGQSVSEGFHAALTFSAEKKPEMNDNGMKYLSHDTIGNWKKQIFNGMNL
jgi:hypothetical protein